MSLEEQLEAAISSIAVEPTPAPVSIVSTTPTQPSTRDQNTLGAGIQEFKLDMLRIAKEKLKNDGHYMETRELKDLNTIIKDLEASTLKQDNQGPTINILVQNMLDQYHDDI